MVHSHHPKILVKIDKENERFFENYMQSELLDSFDDSKIKEFFQNRLDDNKKELLCKKLYNNCNVSIVLNDLISITNEFCIIVDSFVKKIRDDKKFKKYIDEKFTIEISSYSELS